MSSDLPKLYQTQISLTEWFEKMNHQDSAALRIEDNEKRERLKVLNNITGLPFDKPHQFLAEEVANRTPEFQKFLQEHGGELCALRLIPLDLNLPKLRTRGASIHDSLIWFDNQNIDPAKYRADFVPHPADHIWSTIFVVNRHGIFGEIIKGSHNQLTQGFYNEGEPIIFAYENFTNWRLSPANPEAESYLKEVINLLELQNKKKQEELSHQLQAIFAKDYLCGYFETVASGQFGTWFIDYNRILGGMYQDFVFLTPGNIGVNGSIMGQAGSPGKAIGKVKLVSVDNINDKFPEGSVLVCEMTTPAYVPLMQKAIAIVTDKGGILSHAAIVAREMNVPCVVGTKNSTQILKDNDLVEVDAYSGTVKIINE
jgi:phosphohistidine swiveling domain-containing protein